MAKSLGPFKNRVKEIRVSLVPKVSQSELSKRLISRGFEATASYISQIESWHKDIPYRLAVAICEELGYDKSKVTDVFLTINLTGSLGNDCPPNMKQTG